MMEQNKNFVSQQKNIRKFFRNYQNPNEIALSIGKHAPMPNHTAVKNPNINVKLAIGRLNGF